MGTADLHMHTALGDGLATLPALLRYVQTHTDLDVIAVTEHENVEASLRLRELHAHGCYRFEVVTGAEITTLEGHLLALFIERPVPSFRSLAHTIDAIHAQGGLCLIPHPMSHLTRSIGRHGIERILARRADGLWFDGIELANPTPAGRVVAARARRLNARAYHLPVTGGSDAHFLPMVGSGRTLFAGTSAADLRAALVAGETRARLYPHPTLREIGARAIAQQSWRALWATPGRMIWIPGSRSAVAR